MYPDRRVLLWAALGTLILCILTGFVFVKSQAEHTPFNADTLAHRQYVDGDWEQGRKLLSSYGCGACHYIPGIAVGNSYAGPLLTNWSQRSFIAGNLPNTPENLIKWIVDPQAVEPGTAMPVLGVSEEEARHMSAYLYSLGRYP